MKKFVAIMLTLTLVAALLVTPALAAERASLKCPNDECNGANLVRTSTGTEEIYTSGTVSSCDYYSSSHTHVYYRMKWKYVCENGCGYSTYAWASSNSRTFCGASNMWLGIDIVDQIM